MLAARTLFVETCIKLIKDGQATNQALASRLMMADLKEVHKLLEHTVADPLTAPEAAKMAGIKMVVIKSGKYKGAGIEGTSLDEGQMMNLQASVDEIHSEFKAAVLMKRKMVKAEAMEGQTFSGKQAAAQGLVTGLADSFGDALRSF